ncbi:ABC transporter substrate-binding protein [Legionella cardiaca]|uniref:ABC transporter substrate binding protein n=1 Tax=Legionella cardiaca TaxID=1071983 RepID=A0ABY8AR53_9GAMM|nr:ABC transporter substrate binding protein [Legionella cardiaca]WED43003.1 ABC transporter substrate binding protein [Legionella cardiaca]
MSTKYLTTFCTGLFLLAVFFFLAYQHQHKPRIFILHSYNANMPWVQSLNEGVRKVFGDKPYISLRYFYMDTRHHHSKGYLERIRKSLIVSINAWKPDILVAFDHDAQNMAVREFGSSGNLKIILAGITDSKRWLEYENTPHVTGITEQIPVKAIREILSLIFPRQKRIYYLSDNSAAAKTLDKDIAKQNWGSYELVTHKRVKTYRQWQAAVHEAEQTADILLVSIYHAIKDEKKQRIKSKILVNWMNENSRIPVVGVYESFIIDGGILAIAISGLEQGYTAAWLAFNIIEKKLSIQNVPLLHGKTFSLFIHKEILRNRFPEVHIPVIIDAFSKSHWTLDALSTPELDIPSIEKLRLKKSI